MPETTDNTRTRVGLLCAALLSSAVCIAAERQPEELAKQIYDITGVTGGFVIHAGCGDGTLTAALRRNDSYIVQGLARTEEDLEQAREYIQSQGLYGQVSVDLLTGDRLPYVDNLATMLVTGEDDDITEEEIRRVLAPRGTACVRTGGSWRKFVKPRPADIDSWTHYFHDSTGNPVARDLQVDLPRGLRWVGSPRWARYHDHMASVSAMVCSPKRMFYVIDEGSKASVILPSHWKVVGRDAFNGTILWERKIDDWHPQLYPFKSGPAQLTRRLVTAEGRLYLPLGRDEPMSVLSAASGEIFQTYDETAATEEIIAANGTVLALATENPVPWDNYSATYDNCGKEKDLVAAAWAWDRKPRRIMAFDAKSGRARWTVNSTVAPLTLASDGERVVFHDGDCIVCLDHRNGERLWRSKPLSRESKIPTKTSHRLILYGDYVFFAGLDNRMRGLSAKDGKILWTEEHPRSGHNSMEDLMVMQGLVWAGQIAGGKHSGIHYGREMATGELKKEFAPDVETYWFHHRCYPSKATEKYILASRTGIEFIDPKKEHWRINHWIRGGCLYGIMPANGMIYTPPHDCACYAEAKTFGFRAVGPKPTEHNPPPNTKTGPRLVKGPAFASDIPEAPAGYADWPTFRCDNARSGFSRTTVSANLRRAWTAELGDSLTSPVVANGLVFVADTDAHRLFALREHTGRIAWTFDAGARIDSPPTVWKGRVFFGSRDGYVYSLRAADGAPAWRFRAAPRDVRLLAFEQVESVWPVHGSVLIEDGTLYCVAGRSMFLDGGMLMLRIDPQTGRLISQTVFDECLDGNDGLLQDRIMKLQMPVALPDILSCDDDRIYMRSQEFTKKGERRNVGPHSKDEAEQASIQAGNQKHLFAPFGFLDGSWFHRSYWLYGRSYASGAGGWSKAAHYAPAGRILVFDDENVYGYGRTPEHYRWTSRLEYQLFSTPREIPDLSELVWRRKRSDHVAVGEPGALDPANKALTVEAWVCAVNGAGAIVAHGATLRGYALYLDKGRPGFAVRVEGKLFSLSADQRVDRRWTHLAGVLKKDGQMRIYVNGDLANTGSAESLIPTEPGQGMQIGADMDGGVGDYESPFGIGGTIDEVMIYHDALSADQIRQHYEYPGDSAAGGIEPVLYYPFNGGRPVDTSGLGNDGQLQGASVATGIAGDGIGLSSPDAAGSVVMIPRSDSLDPSQKPLSAEAWVKAEDSGGVIVAQGGSVQGYSLYLDAYRPVFTVCADRGKTSVVADHTIGPEWTHLVGTVDSDKQLRIYVDGALTGTGEASSLIGGNPGDAMEIGADEGLPVGEYSAPYGLKGTIDQVSVYARALTGKQVKRLFENPGRSFDWAEPMARYGFDNGKAEDLSGNGHHGLVVEATPVKGRIGDALRFSGRIGGRNPNAVAYPWRIVQPGLMAFGLVVAGENLFAAGPPDLVDEDEALYAAYSPKMRPLLAEQDAALRGERGAALWVMAKSSGDVLNRIKLKSPPAWNGLIAANGKLYLTTMDGKVICFSGE